MNAKKFIEYIDYFKKLRESHEPIGYLSRKAYEGYHFVYWNRELGRLVSLPPSKNIFNLPEISTQADKFENFLLSTNFTFTVVPRLLSDKEGTNAAMYLGILARDDYKKLQIQNKLSQLIKYALFDNISFFEVSLNDRQDDAEVKVWDMYDILFDSRIRDWSKQKLVIKVVKKKIDEIKSSGLYTSPSKIYTDAGVIQTWKDLYEAEKYTQNFANLGKGEVILFECFYLDNGNLRITTIDYGGSVYRDEKYSIDHIPIYPFQVYSGSYYQSSFIHRLIPINRMIDLISKRVSDLILRLAKGGWIVQEQEDLDAQMNEETGQIIRYTATKPEQIDMPNIPPFIIEWLSTLFSLTERFGITPIISGQLPQRASGIRSQSMIEGLVSQAYQNYSNTINNLRNILISVLKDIFLFRYEIWNTPREIIFSDIGGELKKMRFVSEKSRDIEEADENTIFIPKQYDRFDVEIDNALGYTIEAQKEAAIQLAQLGLIDKEIVKRIFKLGSTAYLMEAQEKIAIETPDMQALIKNFDSLSDEEKQGLITTLKSLGRVSPQVKKNVSPDLEKQILGEAEGSPPSPSSAGETTQQENEEL